jgi:hypothetical protein
MADANDRDSLEADLKQYLKEELRRLKSDPTRTFWCSILPLGELNDEDAT